MSLEKAWGVRPRTLREWGGDVEEGLSLHGLTPAGTGTDRSDGSIRANLDAGDRTAKPVVDMHRSSNCVSVVACMIFAGSDDRRRSVEAMSGG